MLSGIRGYSGENLNSIQFLCADVTVPPLISGAQERTSFHDFTCPAGSYIGVVVAAGAAAGVALCVGLGK